MGGGGWRQRLAAGGCDRAEVENFAKSRAPAKSRRHRHDKASQNISRRRFISPIPPISFSLRRPPAAATRPPLPLHGAADSPQKDGEESGQEAAGQWDERGESAVVAHGKAPALKKKPEGWTDDQWQQDCLRRKLSTAERKGRRAAELEKKAQAARQHHT
ncbi:hypothetical protein QYE76_016624 [Lolium multiflorum]|uniref:Uncharacterized protein n=1 Tax=Lolium multiflorum TaxID=4521 RepID=A0AAD8PVY2_LOLMU|nr:hypothetical protein QYE76_016624 [Lolium multiflorum]